MPIRVQLPNGRIAEFPDGMSNADIEAALAATDQRSITENSNFIAQAARIPGRIAGGLMSTLGTAIDAAQLDVAPDAVIGRDNFIRNLPFGVGDTFANVVNRAPEIGNTILAQGGKWAASGADALGLPDSVGDTMRAGAQEFENDNTRARAEENRQRQAAGMPTLEQENAMLPANALGKVVTDAGRATTDFFTSDETRAQEQDLSTAWQKPGLMPTIEHIASDPFGFANVMAPAIGESMVGAGLVGRIAKTGLMGMATAEAEAAGARMLASGADDLAVTAAKSEGLIAGTVRANSIQRDVVLAEQTLQVSEMNARQSRDAIMLASEEELQRNPVYRNLASELGPEAARQELARRVFDGTFAANLPIAAATTVIPGRAGLMPVEMRLAGVTPKPGLFGATEGIKGRLGRAAVQGSKEAGGEFVQEMGDQLAGNVAGVHNATADSYTQDVLKAGVVGVAGGFTPGAISGLFTSPAAQQGASEADGLLQTAYAAAATIVPPVQQQQQPPVQGEPAGASAQALTVENWTSRGGRETRVNVSDSTVEGSAGAISFEVRRDAEDRAPLQMWVTRDGKLTERGKAFTAEGEQVNLWNNGTPEQKAQVVALLRERGNHAIGSPERKGIDQQIAAVVTGPQQDAASTSANPLPNGLPIGDPSPTTSAVPSAPPTVRPATPPTPVAAPQTPPAPLDNHAASTAQPAEPAAQPALGDLGLTTPADPLEQQLLAAGAAPVLAPRVPLMGDATGATDGQANPLETGRMDVPVQPGAATAPAPVSGDAAGAPQAGVNAPPAPVGGQSPSATDSVPAAGQGSETQASVSTLAGGQSQASQPEGVGPVNERLRTHARRLQAGITAALTASNRGRKGGSKVRVFYSAKDAIAAGFDVQDDQDGFYEPTTGTIGVIADQTDSLARGLWVALHEQSGHHGLRETFNNDAALEAELGRAGTNPIVRAVAEAMQRDRANRGRMEDALAVEEALAELEAAVKTGDWSEIKDRYGVEASDLAKSEVGGVMRRMLRAIRAAISRVAGSSSAYSNEDVMALLENAHRAGLRSRRGYNGRNEQRSSTRRLAEDGRLPADGSRVEPVRERMGDASPEGGVDGQRADGVRRGASQRDGARPGARLAGARSRVRLRGYNERMRDIDGPDPKLVAVAEQYARENGIRLRRQREYAQVDPERAARIADAYAAMPHAPNDPAVREAYAELIRQTTAQYRALEQAGYKFWLFDPDNDPYAGNPASALRDLRATQTMGVYPTAAGFGSDASFDPSDNPLLADTGIRWPYGSQDGELRTVYANDLFRAVHDAFGHGLEGAGFRAQGEENAWQAHVRLFTGSAVAAITSETRGQNSWLNYGPAGESNRTAPVEETVFADQKTGIMPEWTWTEGRVADQESRNDRPQRTLASTARRSDAAGNRRARGVAAPQGRGSSGEAWHGRAPRPGAVNVRGIHYSNTAGLKALAGSKYGTNHRGAEARRLDGDAWRDTRYEVLKNRVYFYPDDSKLAARGETIVGRAAVYEQSFDNIYDSETDPRDLWDMASERSDEDGVSVGGAFEYIVHKAGYDGYRTDDMMVVIGRKAVAVKPLKTKASTRKPTINELGMYSAVEKAVLEMPLPAWKKEDGSAAGADVWAKLRTMPGVKQEELKWLGIEDFLLYPHSSQETAPPKFTREKVAEFVRNNGVNIELVLADQMAMDEDAEFNWREEADMDPSNWDGRSEDMMYEFNAQNGRRAADLWWWDWSDWIDDNQDKIQEALGEDLDAYSVEEYESDGRTYYGVIARGHEIRSEFLTEDDAQAFIEGLVDQYYSFSDIKNHPNGGMDVLIDLAREDAEAKAEEAAEREYMDEPYYTMSDRETGIEAYGNNDIGWTVRGPDGEDIADSVYSVSEVEVQARQWLIDNGMGADPSSPGAAKWGDYVTPGSSDNYREYKLTLPDNPGDPFVYDSHFDDENIVAFLRVTDRKKVAEGDPPVQAPPMPDDWARPGAAREKGITVAKLNEALADLARGERPEWVMPYVRDQHASIEEVTRIVRATLDEHQAAWERENTPAPVRRDGVPTFFIDEFQSDWHQHGRKDGYEGDGSKEEAAAKLEAAKAEFDAAQEALFNARDAAVEALVAGGVEDFHAREAVAKMRGGDIDMDVGRALGYAFANGLPNSGVTPELGATLYAHGKAAEVQQAARDKKYRLQNIPNPVPDVPFKSDGWISLGLKTAIIEAVKTGKKALAWADAQVVAERWSDRYIKAYTSQYNEKMPSIVKKLTGQTPKHLTLGGEAYPSNVVSPVEYDKQLNELGDKEQSIEDRLQALPGFPRPTTQQALQDFVAGNPEAMALQAEAQQVRNEIGALKDKYRNQTLPQGYWVIPITEEVEAKVAQGLPTFSSTRRTPAQAQAARTVTLNALAAQGIPQGNVTWTLDKKQRDARTTQARRVLQDRMIDARNIRDAIETATGQPLDDLLDVYQGENLMHGRAEEGIERIRRELVDPLKADMVQARRRANVSNEDVHRYLWAKHAQERNARIASINPAMPDGGSGLTSQEAQDILDAFDRAGKTAWLERIGRRVKAVRKNTLKTLLDSGQITQELHDKLDRMYQHYVPLRGKDGEGEQRIGAGRGIDVRGKPVQRALGRGSEPKDILGELVGDAERAVVQSAKAEVGRMLLRMALQFPNADVWQVEPVIIEPKFSEATGEVYLSIAQPDKETTIIVMHRGRPYSVKLVDPQLRDAVMRYGIEGWDGVAKVLGWANRWLSAVSTRFNPAFVGVNLIRDAIQGSIAIASELGGTALADAGKLYLPAMGAMWKAAKGAGDSSVPDARKSMVDWAREFAEAGGKTGYASLSDPETIQQRIEAEMASIGDLLRQRKPIMAVTQALERSTIIHGVERANDAVENALRLAVYVHLRKSGRTQPKAAQYAKNVTINFNRRGQLTGALNALYLFFNASMQGGHRTLQLLKDPRVLTTLASMGAAQSAIALSAGMMKFEDDDETLWEQIPDYVREKAFVIPTGFSKTGDPQYIAIPMPFGFNLFTAVGGYPALLSSETWKKRQEHGPAGTLVNSFARSAIDAFSVVPLGEDAWWLPTLARMQRNFSANKDDLGNSIRSMNAQRGDGPRASAGKADTPELFRDIATALNRLGGGDEVTKPVQWLDYAPEDIEWMMSQVTGGLGSTVQQTMRAASRAGAGLELAPGDWPISSRIVGSQRRERVQQRMYYEARDRMEEGLERLRLAYAKEGLDGFESAKHDLGTAYDGVVIARYKTTNRERGYRRGDIRADEVTGRPIFVAVPGSTFDAYKQAMRAQDGYGDAIKSEYMDGEQPFAERLTDIDALQKERAARTREFMRQWNN